MSLLREQRPRVILFVSLGAWCAALLLARRVYTGSPAYFFLAWNLILAAVPIVASVLWERAHRSGAPAAARWAWAIVWLAFLPNAPYIVTDFIHLHARAPVPLWYDIAMMVSFACTGLMLGWASVADVHAMVERRRGRAAAWMFVSAALLLCGFGIYVGRFLRWNSWDLLTQPQVVAADVLASATTAHLDRAMVGLSGGIAMLWLLVYLALATVGRLDAPRAQPG